MVHLNGNLNASNFVSYDSWVTDDFKSFQQSGSPIPEKYHLPSLTITTKSGVHGYTQAQEASVLADPEWIITEKPQVPCVL